jgi:hypothetical protein
VLKTDDERRIIIANGKMAQKTMIKLPKALADDRANAPASMIGTDV